MNPNNQPSLATSDGSHVVKPPNAFNSNVPNNNQNENTGQSSGQFSSYNSNASHNLNQHFHSPPQQQYLSSPPPRVNTTIPSSSNNNSANSSNYYDSQNNAGNYMNNSHVRSPLSLVTTPSPPPPLPPSSSSLLMNKHLNNNISNQLNSNINTTTNHSTPSKSQPQPPNITNTTPTTTASTIAANTITNNNMSSSSKQFITPISSSSSSISPSHSSSSFITSSLANSDVSSAIGPGSPLKNSMIGIASKHPTLPASSGYHLHQRQSSSSVGNNGNMSSLMTVQQNNVGNNSNSNSNVSPMFNSNGINNINMNNSTSAGVSNNAQYTSPVTLRTPVSITTTTSTNSTIPSRVGLTTTATTIPTTPSLNTSTPTATVAATVGRDKSQTYSTPTATSANIKTSNNSNTQVQPLTSSYTTIPTHSTNNHTIPSPPQLHQLQTPHQAQHHIPLPNLPHSPSSSPQAPLPQLLPHHHSSSLSATAGASRLLNSTTTSSNSNINSSGLVNNNTAPNIVNNHSNISSSDVVRRLSVGATSATSFPSPQKPKSVYDLNIGGMHLGAAVINNNSTINNSIDVNNGSVSPTIKSVTSTTASATNNFNADNHISQSSLGQVSTSTASNVTGNTAVNSNHNPSTQQIQQQPQHTQLQPKIPSLNLSSTNPNLHTQEDDVSAEISISTPTGHHNHSHNNHNNNHQHSNNNNSSHVTSHYTAAVVHNSTHVSQQNHQQLPQQPQQNVIAPPPSTTTSIASNSSNINSMGMGSNSFNQKQTLGLGQQQQSTIGTSPFVPPPPPPPPVLPTALNNTSGNAGLNNYDNYINNNAQNSNPTQYPSTQQYPTASLSNNNTSTNISASNNTVNKRPSINHTPPIVPSLGNLTPNNLNTLNHNNNSNNNNSAHNNQSSNNTHAHNSYTSMPPPPIQSGNMPYYGSGNNSNTNNNISNNSTYTSPPPPFTNSNNNNSNNYPNYSNNLNNSAYSNTSTPRSDISTELSPRNLTTQTRPFLNPHITNNNANAGKPYTANNSTILNGSSMNNNNANSAAAVPNPIRKASANSRIDPSQMPRPPVLESGVMFYTRSGSGRKIPPLSNTGFQSVDTGNCKPRFMRITTAAPANCHTLQTSSGLPLGLVITPFATLQNNEEEIPVVDFGSENIYNNSGPSNSSSVNSFASSFFGGSINNNPKNTVSNVGTTTNTQHLPPRCTRCKGYINPSVSWLNEGNSWQCNFCNMINPTPAWYFSSLDGGNVRLDRNNRPELCKGTYDIIAPTDYCTRPLQESVYIFAIDISPSALLSGLTVAAIRSVQSALSQLTSVSSNSGNNDTTSSFTTSLGTKVGIFTFDSRIQFYHINSNSSSNDQQVKLMVIESDDPYPALPDSYWIFPIHSHLSSLQLLLTKITELIPSSSSSDNEVDSQVVGRYSSGVPSPPPSMMQETRSCPTAAIKIAQIALEKIGGQIYLFTSNNATIGYGKTKNREQVKLYGTDDEILLYGNIEKIAENQSASSLNVANISNVITNTVATGSNISKNNTSHHNTSGAGTSSSSTIIKDADKINIYQQYTQLGHDCNNQFIGVSIFLANVESEEFRDTNLYSWICDNTGGTFYHSLGSLMQEENVYRLETQLLYHLKSVAGYENVIKLRTSVGLKLVNFLGKGKFNKIEEQTDMAILDKNTTFCCTLQHTATLKDEEKIHIQLAVLYTNPHYISNESINIDGSNNGYNNNSSGRRSSETNIDGEHNNDSKTSTLLCKPQRMIRIHNLCLYCTSSANVMFKHADLDCTVAFITKIAMEKALNHPLYMNSEFGARFYLTNILIEVLYKYRMTCSAQSPRTQLILPETLKLLPLYTLGLFKHPALIENKLQLKLQQQQPASKLGSSGAGSAANSGKFESLTPRDRNPALAGINIRGHERAYEINRLRSLPVKDVINTLYPRLFALHAIADNEDYIIPPLDPNTTQEVDILSLPRVPVLSSEYFENDGLYVLNDNTVLWLYCGKNLPASDLLDWFGYDVNSNSLMTTVRPKYLSFATSNTFYSLSSKFGTSVSDKNNGSNNNDSPSKQQQRQPLPSAANNMQTALDLLRYHSAYKQEVRVVWGDETTSTFFEKFATRLVEDSIKGEMSYVDFLCKIHSKVQAKP